MTVRANVLAANEAFYRAFRTGDLAAMKAIWSKRADVACYHPNWPGLSGPEDVLHSWASILSAGAPPGIRAETVTTVIAGDTAMVFCTEDLGIGRTIASNVFIKEGGRWRMFHHQARPLPHKAAKGAGRTDAAE